MTTGGPYVATTPPNPGAPMVSLLRTATVIPHLTDLDLAAALDANAQLDEIVPQQRSAAFDARWGNGFEFQPWTCADASVFDPCTSAVMPVTPPRPAKRAYEPFTVDAYDRCSTLGGVNINEYEARARQMLAARESKAIAHEFWTGALKAANPHLASTGPNAGPDTVTTVGTALSPHNGVAALVQALADGNGGVGMIHVRPRLLQMLTSISFLRWENGNWYTSTGNKVVADAGYPGTGPNGQAVANSSGAITEWAFATDLVEVHLGPVKVVAEPLTSQSVDDFNNDVVVRAQRLAAPVWNGCVLAAASITTPAAD